MASYSSPTPKAPDQKRAWLNKVKEQPGRLTSGVVTYTHTSLSPKQFKVFSGWNRGGQHEGARAQSKNGVSSCEGNLPEDVLGGKKLNYCANEQ